MLSMSAGRVCTRIIFSAPDERLRTMPGQQPYRMIIRHSIIGLPSGATYQLRFDQIGDVFPPGMVGDDIHPNALADLRAFAEDVGCTVTKADELKAFVFRKRS
jgi:hypothetical protein